MKYEVSLRGCDDETAFEVDLTYEEAALLRDIAERSVAASEYGCMPKMFVEVAA